MSYKFAKFVSDLCGLIGVYKVHVSYNVATPPAPYHTHARNHYHHHPYDHCRRRTTAAATTPLIPTLTHARVRRCVHASVRMCVRVYACMCRHAFMCVCVCV